MFATAATTIPTPMIKRSRDQVDGDPSPGKRVKTNAMVEEERARESQAALSAPPPSPTPHWSTALAKQQQRALEMMQGGAIDQEDVEMGGESAAGPDGVLPSNPQHPWNHVSMALGGDGSAPRMEHQHSASGNSSSADSSLPSTPLDLPFNEQWDMSSSKPIQTPSYPSPSNPTSFTNFNGTTVVFSTSPPLSVYPPPPATMSTPQQQNPLHAAAGFPMHAWSASTSGVMRMEGPSMGAGVGAPPQSPEVVRELNLPSYGWDSPKQSNTLNMGAHLV